MYTVTFLYNLHIYIKMAPQGCYNQKLLGKDPQNVLTTLRCHAYILWTRYKIGLPYILTSNCSIFIIA